MKKIKKQTLAEFEKYLLQSVNERPKTPFSTEEVLQILKNFDPPDDLEDLRDANIVQVMKSEAEKRRQLEQKLKNYSLIHSLGELVKSYCDFNNISPIKFALAVGLSNQELENYEKDRVAPDSLRTDILLKLMQFIGIPIDEMIKILKKTINLVQIKQETSITPSYTRIDKRGEDSQKMRVKDSAMKELLLTLKDEEETEMDKFEQLKDELTSEYEKNHLEYETFEQCYTIRTRKRNDKINKIMQQL